MTAMDPFSALFDHSREATLLAEYSPLFEDFNGTSGKEQDGDGSILDTHPSMLNTTQKVVDWEDGYCLVDSNRGCGDEMLPENFRTKQSYGERGLVSNRIVPDVVSNAMAQASWYNIFGAGQPGDGRRYSDGILLDSFAAPFDSAAISNDSRRESFSEVNTPSLSPTDTRKSSHSSNSSWKSKLDPGANSETPSDSKSSPAQLPRRGRRRATVTVSSPERCAQIERSRAKNRQAASRYRKKHKAAITELESTVKALNVENRSLQATVRTLGMTLHRLNMEMFKHSRCEDHQIQQYVDEQVTRTIT